MMMQTNLGHNGISLEVITFPKSKKVFKSSIQQEFTTR